MIKKHVAFLRGVNVGKRPVKKHELIEVFTGLGLGSPQTFLASGNILFESDSPPVASEIEKALHVFFGFEIGVVLRSVEELNQFVKSRPFADHEGNADIKLYLSMAAGPIGGRLDGVNSVTGDYDLVEIRKCDYFTAAFRQENGRYGAGLDQFEKKFRDLTITTRNWNTIMRILKKAGV